MINEIYKNFVLYAVLAFWPASIYIVRKWKIGKGHSLSHHAASERRAYYLFALAVSIETICWLLFIYKWFAPTFHMGLVFKILFGSIAFGHFISGVVPETKGWAYKTHRWAAYIVAWLFLPAFFILAATPNLSTDVRLLSVFFIGFLCWLWYMYTKPKTHESFLIFQAMYIATLPITLIVATYLR